MRPSIGPFIPFALVAALAAGTCGAMPSTPTNPQNHLTPNVVAPRAPIFTAPATLQSGDFSDSRFSVVARKEQDAVELHPMMDKSIEEHEDSTESAGEGLLCTAKHLYKRFVTLRHKIDIIQAHYEEFNPGSPSSKQVVKELNIIIYELKETVFLLKVFKSRGIVFDYGSTEEFGMDFEVLLTDIFLGLRDICSKTKELGIRTDGIVLVTLNKMIFEIGSMIGALGCVVTGVLGFTWRVMHRFFHVCLTLKLDLKSIGPLLSPVGLADLIDDLL